MKILAVDTATESCSIACSVDEDVVIETTFQKKQTHSKHLFDLIHSGLQLAGIRINQLDGFAVTKGPGSFTGVRIGISAVKGLAMATDKPIVGISCLEALAMQAAIPSMLICPMIDARRNEVYSAGYRLQEGRLMTEFREQAIAPQQFISLVNAPSVFIGSGAVCYRRRILNTIGDLAYFAPIGQHVIRASTVALLSVPRFCQSRVENLTTFTPTYLRKSDAEKSHRPIQKSTALK